jgi:hypothetical protein
MDFIQEHKARPVDTATREGRSPCTGQATEGEPVREGQFAASLERLDPGRPTALDPRFRGDELERCRAKGRSTSL